MDDRPARTERPTCPGCRQRDARIAELEGQVSDLRGRLARLEQQLEASQRAGKRQAAPFRKEQPQGEPKRPGRKSGDDYGTRAFRAAPAPDQIDEAYEAPLPARCPHCGEAGGLERTAVSEQYQSELVLRPVRRQFTIHRGRCSCCRNAVQGRHALQTSEAVGAAGSQLGADAQAALVYLNKRAGLSYGKVSDVMGKLFGLSLTPGAACHVIQRAGTRCEPTHRAIVERINASPAVTADETGWRVGAAPGWLHAAATPRWTAYHIDPRRGLEASRKLIQEGYDGVLIHDGWAPYKRFDRAAHQTCLAHLLRRCHELLETAVGGAVLFPRQVRDLLKQAVTLRAARARGELAPAEADAHADDLEEQLARRLRRPRAHAGNDRFARHLADNLPHLTTCLRQPGVEATNWRAEQAIRPAVVNRKVWGGNRTPAGAHAQAVLMTVLQTCRQQGRDATAFLAAILRGQNPQPLALPP